MKRIIFYSIIGVVLVAGGVFYWANRPIVTTKTFTSERAFTPESLTVEANAVVSGQFVSSRTYIDRTTGSPVILTDWQFAIDQTLKGDTSGTITITLEGGTVGRRSEIVADGPTVKKNQRSIAYLLSTVNGRWIPLSPSQGLFLENGADFVAKNGAKTSVANVKALLK